MEPERYEYLYELGSSHLPVSKKLIINAALTGNVHTKEDNPALPITPDEVARDVKKCFDAGARVFHLHARESDGSCTWKKEAFEEIFSKVRKNVPQAILCATTSGRVYKNFEQRSEVLTLEGELKPDFASLTLGSLNFPKSASVNSPDTIAKLASFMKEKGIRPELEVFETGMINYAVYMKRKGYFDSPMFFNLILGNLGSMPARMADICHMVGSIPPGSCWGAGAAGRFQLPTNAAAVLMGGHVRVGLEDNIYLDYNKSEPATNESLVQRIARIAKEVGRPLASPREAREILGLGER
jgi:3-keto-5-aminohexanoate cleavage enzyme